MQGQLLIIISLMIMTCFKSERALKDVNIFIITFMNSRFKNNFNIIFTFGLFCHLNLTMLLSGLTFLAGPIFHYQ